MGNIRIDQSKKIHVKHLFAYKFSKKKKVLDIAILTDDNQYIEYTLQFKATSITQCVAMKLKNIFSSYQLNASSDVVINDVFTDDNPLYLYFMLLHQQLNFKFSHVDDDQIVRRIATLHSSFLLTKSEKKAGKSIGEKNITRNLYMQKLWRKLIEYERCPWITQKIDYYLQMKSKKFADAKKMLRLGLYYMVVKNYLYNIKIRSDRKNLEKQNLKTKEYNNEVK